MGFLAPIAAAAASAASTVGGTLAAGVGGLAHAAAGIGSLVSGATGASGGALTGGALSSLKGLTTVGSLVGTGITAAALNPPKIPPPPQPPSPGSLFQKSSLIGPSEGSFNGTFVSGTNQRGGGKSLLGQ